MKEAEPNGKRLTNQPQEGYSGDEGNIMPDGGNAENQQPKNPNNNQKPPGGQNPNGEQKTQNPISDEALFAKEIAEDEEKFHMKWAEYGDKLQKETLERFRRERSEKMRKQGPSGPEQSAGGGGQKPPENPPKPPSGENPNDKSSNGKDDSDKKNGSEGPSENITDPRLLEIKKRIEDAKKDASENQSLVIPEFYKSQLDEIADLSTKGLVDKDQAYQIKNELFSLLAKREKGYDEYRTIMLEIKKLKDEIPKEKELKKSKVMNLLRHISPISNTIDPELTREVVKDETALEYLVNRIISAPLDAEQSGYRLSFYGGINLDQVKDLLNARTETGDKKANKNYQRVLIISEAAELFHSMNLQIITGNLKQFVDGARAITPDQLQTMQNIKGVSQIMRLFDEEILMALNRDGIINSKNYDEIMGVIRNPDTGEITDWGEGTVKRRLQKLIDTKKIEELNNLEAWQIKWAFHVGKIMGNLSLRSAEQISLSKVQGADYKMASIPQEHAARLMNWLGWTGLRYGMGDVRGGVFLAKMTSKLFQRDREEQGYGKNRIKDLGWQKIDDTELAGICGVNGIWASWRNNLVILNQAPTKFSKKKDSKKENSDKIETIENRPTTVKDFIDLAGKYWSKDDNQKNDNSKLITKEKRIEELRLRGKRLDEALQKETAARLKEVFLRKLTTKDKDGKDVTVFEKDENGKDVTDKNGERIPILELNTGLFNNALGIVLKHSSITPTEKDKDAQVLKNAKEEVRQAIWRKIAEDNPLAIIPYLQGTTLGKDANGKDVKKEDVKKIDVTKNDEGVGLEIKTEEGKDGKDIGKWNEFVEKLSILHELRMQKLRNGEYVSFKKTMEEVKENSKNPEIEEKERKAFEGIILNDKEKEWLTNIEKEGKNISGDLANVRFPNTPFMNDVIFERTDYSKAGAAYYGRRAGGDLASFYEAGEAFGELMVNPGKAKPEEAFKAIGGWLKAIEGPLGTEFAQDRTKQFLEAYLTFIHAGDNLGVTGKNIDEGTIRQGFLQGIAKYFYRDNLYSGVLKGMRKPTSIAQMISGPDAISADEIAMRTYMDVILRDGLTRKAMYDGNGIIKYSDLDKKFRKKFSAGFLGMLLAYLRDLPKIVVAGMIAETGKQVVKDK